MFPERSLPRRIHSGIDGAISKRFLRRLTRFHDRRQCADTENHGQESRGKGSPAVKKDPQQNRKAGHGQANDGNMVDRQVEMGGSKECLDHFASVNLPPPSRKRENSHAGQY
jgi:hypothetical protein